MATKKEIYWANGVECKWMADRCEHARDRATWQLMADDWFQKSEEEAREGGEGMSPEPPGALEENTTK